MGYQQYYDEDQNGLYDDGSKPNMIIDKRWTDHQSSNESC